MKLFHVNCISLKAQVAIFISYKLNFRTLKTRIVKEKINILDFIKI